MSAISQFNLYTKITEALKIVPKPILYACISRIVYKVLDDIGTRIYAFSYSPELYKILPNAVLIFFDMRRSELTFSCTVPICDKLAAAVLKIHDWMTGQSGQLDRHQMFQRKQTASELIRENLVHPIFEETIFRGLQLSLSTFSGWSMQRFLKISPKSPLNMAATVIIANLCSMMFTCLHGEIQAGRQLGLFGTGLVFGHLAQSYILQSEAPKELFSIVRAVSGFKGLLAAIFAHILHNASMDEKKMLI